MTDNARVSTWETWGPVVVSAMQRGASMRTAAGLAGVTGQTVNQLMQRALKDTGHAAHEWARDVRRIQAEQVAETESWHRDARSQGNAPAMQWWLARMDRETYGDDAAKAPPAPEPEPLPDASDDDVERAIRGGK